MQDGLQVSACMGVYVSAHTPRCTVRACGNSLCFSLAPVQSLLAPGVPRAAVSVFRTESGTPTVSKGLYDTEGEAKCQARGSDKYQWSLTNTLWC